MRNPLFIFTVVNISTERDDRDLLSEVNKLQAENAGLVAALAAAKGTTTYAFLNVNLQNSYSFIHSPITAQQKKHYKSINV